MPTRMNHSKIFHAVAIVVLVALCHVPAASARHRGYNPKKRHLNPLASFSSKAPKESDQEGSTKEPVLALEEVKAGGGSEDDLSSVSSSKSGSSKAPSVSSFKESHSKPPSISSRKSTKGTRNPTVQKTKAPSIAKTKFPTIFEEPYVSTGASSKGSTKGNGSSSMSSDASDDGDILDNGGGFFPTAPAGSPNQPPSEVLNTEQVSSPSNDDTPTASSDGVPTSGGGDRDAEVVQGVVSASARATYVVAATLTILTGGVSFLVGLLQ